MPPVPWIVAAMVRAIWRPLNAIVTLVGVGQVAAFQAALTTATTAVFAVNGRTNRAPPARAVMLVGWALLVMSHA